MYKQSLRIRNLARWAAVLWLAWTGGPGGGFGVESSSPATLTILSPIVSPGRVDLSFGGDSGGAEPRGSSSVRSVLELPDGKLFVTGSFTNFNGLVRHGITRLHEDGTPDPTWADPLANGEVRQLLPTRGGAVLIAGNFRLPGQTNTAVARLLANATADPSFHSLAAVQFGFVSGAYALAELPNGKILVGGVGFYYPAEFPWFASQPPPEWRGIVQLRPDGTTDPEFDAGWGVATSYQESLAVVTTIALDSQNRVLIGGFFDRFDRTSTGSLVRLDQTGARDASFNPQLSGWITSLATLSDGRILVAGGPFGLPGGSSSSLLRLETDGTIDRSFGVDVTSFSGLANFTGVAVQNDGRILLSGHFDLANGTPRVSLARFENDGSLDYSFNAGFGVAHIKALALLRNGGIVIGGAFETMGGVPRRSLARLHGGDRSPGPPEIVLDSVHSAPQAGADVVLRSYVSSGAAPACQWFHNDQEVAGATSHTLTLRNVLPGDAGRYHVIAKDSFGATASRPTVLQVAPIDRTPGAIDPEFYPGRGPDGPVYAIAALPRGQLLVGGEFLHYDGQPRQRIARIRSDGTLDDTFGNDLLPDAPVYGIHLLPDGRLLMVGTFTNLGPFRCDGLARLRSDGGLDTSFQHPRPGAVVLAMQPP